nr:MAG TPA: hypothetical protein [Bacteriophage sp.]
MSCPIVSYSVICCHIMSYSLFSCDIFHATYPIFNFRKTALQTI